MIRCSKCEGWGITSYGADGSPNACDVCGGAGDVEPAAVIHVPSRYEKLCRNAESGIGCNKAYAFGIRRCGEGGWAGWYCDQCRTIRALVNAVKTLELEEKERGRLMEMLK